MTKNRRIATDIFNGLYGIEAIDKFIAIEFALTESLDEKENEIWLHLLVAQWTQLFTVKRIGRLYMV